MSEKESKKRKQKSSDPKEVSFLKNKLKVKCLLPTKKENVKIQPGCDKVEQLKLNLQKTKNYQDKLNIFLK